MPTVNEPTSAPSNKLTAATIGAAIGTAFYAMLETKYLWLAAIEVKAALMPAVAALFAFVPGWLKANLTDASQVYHAHRNWVVIGVVLALVLAASAAVGYVAVH